MIMKRIILLSICLVACMFSGFASAQLIQPNTAVTISVQGVPADDRTAINHTYPVSQSGTINMPYIGQVKASGMLPEQLAATLQNLYKNAEIYTNPTFQVIADDVGGDVTRQVVHIGGFVNKPGPVPYRNGLTIWQALQSAGGENAFGSIRRVRLFRDGNMRQYNMRDQNDMEVLLRPNDTIEVPQKNWLGQ